MSYTKTLMKDFLAWGSKNFPLIIYWGRDEREDCVSLEVDSKGGFITACFYLLKFVFAIAESFGMTWTSVEHQAYKPAFVTSTIGNGNSRCVALEKRKRHKFHVAKYKLQIMKNNTYNLHKILKELLL